MKKIILFSVSLLYGIFMLFSFSEKKKIIPTSIKPAVSIVGCQPFADPVLITAAAFKTRFGSEPLMVRKNIDALSTAEINALKAGILKMRSLPYTNPTSWLYQAAIHGTTLPDNLPSWNLCHRPGEGIFFLAWHRMYVYFFERILRKKSGRANLTLPYWDYQVNPVIPAPYRDKSLGNPLYDATRSAAMNNGGALPASIITAFNNSLDIIPYYTFQSDLSSGPHGSVHTTIAGNMAVTTTAAKDPVFMLHHSNIDRLWEVWRSRCDGRSNPIDSVWLNKTYTFFDEFGNPVSMKGSQVVEISTQLNYRYDAMSPIISCPAARGVVVSRETLLKKAAVVEINGQTQKADFSQESPTELESFIRTKNRRNFNFASRNAPERLVITFEGISISQMPQGAMEVYLNLPPGTTPTANSKNFVGLLDLFTAEHHSYMAHSSQAQAMQNMEEVELDATKAAQALGLTLPTLRNSVVSFYVRGPSLNGVEMRTEARVAIHHINFSVDRYQN